MQFFRILSLSLLLSVILHAQVTDPMLDLDFLFSDTLKALNMPAPTVTDQQNREADRSVLLAQEELQREIEKLNREIARLKNRVALLEENRKISSSVVQVDILTDYYTRALKYYNEGSYERATSLFNQVMSESSDTVMRLNSMFWAAECAFRLGNYNRTVILLNEVSQHSSFHRQEDSCILMAASYERLGRDFEAKKFYRACLRDYPGGRYAKLARQKLGEAEVTETLP